MDRQNVRKAVSLGWNVLGASVAGTGHEKAGVPCQDAHLFHVTASGVLLIAFADGAGSASLAEIGAQAAVETALETLKQADWKQGNADDALRNAFKAAKQKVQCEADSQGEEVRELACTLTLLVSDGERTLAGSVGDGAVIVETQDGLVPLIVPERGEFVNETAFLHEVESGNIALRRMEQPITGLAAFTDGLQMLALKLPEAEPHTGFFVPLFGFARHPDADEAQLREFLQSSKVTDRADDDLTLILAVRKDD
jgi:hypothetical protein